nr:putative ribonuclease H-like domain-containing protein [Tanacetum cinerariifolium]
MQEELLQFKIQNVWTLVYCPKGVRPIGTKWVLKNKKDERGIVIKNKARLVAQRYTQEEGIDYDEVFAHVARIKAIRLFLAYASLMGFTVYQMDMKSAFLYGTIDEEVYAMQPPEFQDPEFPVRVYKVEKAMYGLHQTLFIRRQRGHFILVQVYVDDIIFGSSNPQLCREFAALMHEKFQMSAMGELNFFLGLQVLQKEDGIFSLKTSSACHERLCLRESYNPFNKIMARLQFCDYHNMVAILEKSEHNVDFHPIVDFVEASRLRYALTFKPTVYVSHIRQFWSTARIETTEEETKILATIEGTDLSWSAGTDLSWSAGTDLSWSAGTDLSWSAGTDLSWSAGTDLTGSESRPPMLNKENYVPWSSRLLRYAKCRPNGKLIHNSILNGPYVRKMIPKPGDVNRDITVTETFHLQTDDELSDKELKQIEADDQAIQTILLGLPEDIYAVVDKKKAKLFNEWERFTSNEEESIESYYHRFLKLMNDLKRNKYFPEKIASNLKFLNNLQPEWNRHVTIVHQTKDLHTADYTHLYDFLKYNQKENYLQQPMLNPEDITDPTTAMNMALALMAKAFKLNYSTPTNNNQRISSDTKDRQIAQPCMNMGQDKQMQIVGGNGGNQFRKHAGNLAGYNDVIRNQIRNGNLVAARAEGNEAGQNGNQIRCYNCRGVADLDEIEEVNANCILMANLQQASTSGTQADSALVYDTDGSAERIWMKLRKSMQTAF